MAQKTAFIGFKEDPKVAAEFKAAAEKQGGASKVLQRFVRRFIRRLTRKAA
jgi:hypothetical protein